MSEPVDVAALLDSVGDDRRFLASLVEDFLADAQDRMTSLERAVASRDEGAAVTVSHKLAGAAAMLCLRPFAAVLRAIELRARAGAVDWERLGGELADARAELARARDALADIAKPGHHAG